MTKGWMAALAVLWGQGALASPEIAYHCEGLGDGAYRVVISAEDPGRAEAIYEMGMDSGGAGSVTPLMQAPSGSGVRYEGDGLVFVAKGQEDGLLSVGADTLVCPLQVAAVLPVPAMSLGGNVRSGPGTEFADIGSTAQGTPLTLVARTGVIWNGYEWFEIREANGDGGFQWGGIICAPDQPVEGVFEHCE